MPRFVVLLRGVNLGRANKLPMAEFRALLEALGHSDVRTVLNSGNAVFGSRRADAQAHAAAIATAVQQRFGIATAVIVKREAEFAAIVQGNAIAPPASEHARFVVAFAADAAALEPLRALSDLLQDGERLLLTEHAAYLHCRGGLLESPAASALLGKPGRALTARNWGTVLKIATLLGVAVP